MVAPRVTASLEIDRSKPCVYVFTRRVQRTGRARCELNAIDAHVPLSMIRWSHAPWQQYNLYMCMTAWMDNNAARIDAAVHPTDLKELASSAGRGSRPIDEGISYQITSSIHKKKTTYSTTIFDILYIQTHCTRMCSNLNMRLGFRDGGSTYYS